MRTTLASKSLWKQNNISGFANYYLFDKFYTFSLSCNTEGILEHYQNLVRSLLFINDVIGSIILNQLHIVPVNRFNSQSNGAELKKIYILMLCSLISPLFHSNYTNLTNTATSIDTHQNDHRKWSLGSRRRGRYETYSDAHCRGNIASFKWVSEIVWGNVLWILCLG